VKVGERESLSRAGWQREVIAIDFDLVYDGNVWGLGVICEESSPAGDVGF
jgi:hypothetical protein